MTPAGELLAAADRLEALAGTATEGPWTADDGAYEMVEASGWDVDGPGGGYVTRLSRKQDAAYIAAMGPDVGLLLAKWLRFEAGYEADWNETALDLARAINRE